MGLKNLKIAWSILATFFLLNLAGTVHAAINCPGTLPEGTRGVAYSYTFTATNGNGGSPWWRIVMGSLPPGLSLINQSLNSVTLAGTPTTAGTYWFAINHRQPGMDPICFSTIVINAAGCVLNGTDTGGISFGNLDPSGYPAPVNNIITQQVNFQCSAGLAYSIAVTNPVGQLQLTGANTVPFTLGLHANGTGAGAVDIPLLTMNSAITSYAGFVEGVSSFSNPITVEINWAGGSLSAYVNVSDVTVIPACGTPTNGTMNFDIDPSLNTTITASTTANGTSPTVKCTNASQPNVTCETSGGSTAGQLKKGTDNINYNVTTCGVSGKITGNGFGAAPASEIPVGISVVPSAYQSAPPGDYSDNVTVTIAY